MSSETRTNYVIACWMGPRRAEHKPNQNDRASFLRAHINALETFSHSLDQVTVVIAEGGNPDAESFAKDITEMAGVPVEVLMRPNKGMSYAGWNLAHETFGADFTHYIIVEDDYIPFINDFDSLLVDTSRKYDAYICGLTGQDRRIAAISNGVIPEHIWREVSFPSLVNMPDYQCQKVWSSSFLASGHPIEDSLRAFSSPFWLTRALRWYGHPTLPPLFVPVQALGRIVPVAGGPGCVRGSHHVRGANLMFTEDGGMSFETEDDMKAWKVWEDTPLEDQLWRGRYSRFL